MALTPRANYRAIRDSIRAQVLQLAEQTLATKNANAIPEKKRSALYVPQFTSY